MSNSYTPAAKLFGRRIRIMYVAVLVLLFMARMWSVHGVHGFLETDAAHGQMAGIAGRLTGRSIEVTNAVLVRVYAPQTAAADIVLGAARLAPNGAAPSGVQVGRTADLVASAEPAADAQTIPLRRQHLMLAARREKTHQAAGQRFNIPMAIGAPENP